MVDPHANIYIVSKEDDGEGKIFKIPYSAWGRSHYSISSHTGVQIGAPSTHHDPVAGSISPDGREVLIKVIT